MNTSTYSTYSSYFSWLYFLIASLSITNLTIAQSNNPCGAPVLTVGTSCTYTVGTNAAATASPGVPAPGCANYLGGDVWYQITVPAGGALTVQTATGVITDGGLAIYSGPCGSLALVQCDDDSGPGSMSLITLSGQTPGAVLYVRVWEYGNNNNGTFSICATQPPAGPANDNPCSATALPVNASCSFTNSTNANATASAGVPAPGCASYSGGDVWFSVVVPASGSLTVETNPGVITDGGMAIYSGTCSALTLIECDDDDGTGAMSLITLTGQTPGATLFVRVWEFGNDNNGTFGICAHVPPSGPVNDNPCSATALPVNASCVNTLTTNVSATPSSGVPAPGCANYIGADVWYSVVVPAAGNIIIETTGGILTDGGMAIYSGLCSALTLIQCDDDSGNGLMPSITLYGQTPGATLYVRMWEYGNDNNGSFEICAHIPPPPPPPPANDNCIGAYPTTVNTSSCTSQTAGTIGGATASVQDQAACFGTENDDVWFSFVAPATGSISLALNNVAGTTTDLFHSVWTGTCPALTLFGTSCSDPNNSTVSGLTPGATYYVRVYSYFGTAGEVTTFDLCIIELDACGGAANNDWCQAPALLTPGAGNFNSNTSSTFTSDTPANLNSVFCGSSENNSWYQFTATATTATFNFSSVANCFDGIQAEVYSVSTDVNGCCTNFTSVSNCWNPGFSTTGSVVATGLAVGSTYMLMVDGFAGDVCDFQVNNWTANGILPVELVGFFGAAMPQKNVLHWQTASELNNDYFVINRSYDGENFEPIGMVNGIGNSTSTIDYEFTDEHIRTGTVYYRLTQVDIDGTSVQSEIIALNRSQVESGLLGVFPNPTQDLLNVEVNISHEMEDVVIELNDAHGKLIEEKLIQTSGFGIVTFDLEHLKKGIYFIRFVSTCGVSTIKKIIKN